MPEHEVAFFDQPHRPVANGTVHVTPEHAGDEQHARALAAAQQWAERYQAAQDALDDRDALRRRVRELERQVAELMPPVPSEAALEQARVELMNGYDTYEPADVVEIPLPPEPDRSRRLEAYDPGTGETLRSWVWDGRWWRASTGGPGRVGRGHAAEPVPGPPPAFGAAHGRGR